MAVIILFFGIFNFFWGERVPAGGGLGWDGLKYADMVHNFNFLFSRGLLSGYYVQRILPSAMVRGFLLIAGASTSDPNIIRGFELYNLLLLLGGCWIWKRIAEKSDLSLSGRWIGFSGIFLNFECSKQTFYYPVLTDTTALFTALLLLMFYLERRPLALFFTTCIGAFAWPVVSVCGAFLIVFLRTELCSDLSPMICGNLDGKRRAARARNAALGCIALLCLLIIAFLLMTQGDPNVSHACPLPKKWLVAMQASVVPCSLERLITALPSLFCAAIALVSLIGSRAFIRVIFVSIRRAPLRLVSLAILAILIPSLIVKMLANPSLANSSSLEYLLEFMLLPPPGKFFLTFVSLAVFWGPLVLLLMLYWREFCSEARRLGPGFVAIIGISLPLSLMSEPRFLTVAWPFFVLALVLALERSIVDATFKYILGGFTVLYAQFWMKLNLAPWELPDWAALQDFPKEVYFMHYGLWMNWISYSAQFLISLLGAALLYKSIIGFRREKK